MTDDLDWALWPWQQCGARRERRPELGREQFFGRCELRKGHTGQHALERAFYTPRWSTDWTSM